jgi:hypothetical protein
LKRGGAEELAGFVELVGEGGGFDVAVLALILGQRSVFFEVHHEHVFHGVLLWALRLGKQIRAKLAQLVEILLAANYASLRMTNFSTAVI